MPLRRLARIALPIYWAVLAFATHYPTVHIPTNISHRDKVMHFAAFALLAYLYWRFFAERRALGARFVWIAALVLVAYAAIDEYLQQFVGRNTELLDFFANAAGITFALTALELRRRRQT